MEIMGYTILVQGSMRKRSLVGRGDVSVVSYNISAADAAEYEDPYRNRFQPPNIRSENLRPTINSALIKGREPGGDSTGPRFEGSLLIWRSDHILCHSIPSLGDHEILILQ